MMEPGYAVSGRYQIIRPIGEGGMANVYLAQDLILDRQVAVKVLRLDLRNDPNTVRRFKREALSTTELNHPTSLVFMMWAKKIVCNTSSWNTFKGRI